MQQWPTKPLQDKPWLTSDWEGQNRLEGQNDPRLKENKVAVGRISGPLLKANLLRQGVDLAFETDLLYLDVNNSRVGIKTASPQAELDVNGSARIQTLDILDTTLPIGNITIDGGTNTISTTQSIFNIATPNSVIYQDRLQVDDIEIDGSVIRTLGTNQNLEFRPNGTGTINFYGNTNVTGNLHATGNISADGDITIGDQDTDTVTINADIASDLIPDVTNTYTIGNSTKKWAHGYFNDLTATSITTAGLTIGDLDLTLTPGNVFYVAKNGDDAHSGEHPQDPFLTIAQSLSVASVGDTIHIYPGDYEEVFPLNVPAGVTIIGEGIRSVKVTPTSGTNNNNAFVLQGESSVMNVTVADFYYDSVNDTGWAFSFANNFEVTSRSPYVKNVSVITKGSVTSASDPRGFDQADAGRGAKLDGEQATANSREASMLFHSVTFITPGAVGLYATNGARIEWLNSFVYFADKAMLGENGTNGLKGTGRTKVKLSGLVGTPTAGEVFQYTDSQGTVINATVNEVDGNYIYLNNNVSGLETKYERGGKTVVAVDNAQIDTAIKKFGTGSLLLDGTGDYISVATDPDFGFGTGDFTIEGWFYANSVTGTKALVDMRAGTATDTGLYLYADAGVVKVYYNGAELLSGGLLSTTTWTHVAVTRTGSTINLYVNGTRVDSDNAFSSNIGSNKPLLIGSAFNASSFWDGHVDDFRLSAVARYTLGSYTPPLNEVSNDTDSRILLRFNGVDSSSTFEDDVIVLQNIGFGGGAYATGIELADFSDFGCELRSIGSACVYGNYGIYGDGNGVVMYLISQNLAYIGNGKEVDNDPTTVIQSQEVTKLNEANVYFSSVDHKGDFRVGDVFHVNQADGTVNFTNANFNIDTLQSVRFSTGSSTTIIDGDKIQTGNIRLSGNTVESLSGDLNIDAQSGIVNFSDDVNITGDLDVTGDVTIGGNITIGDEATDSIEIVAGIASNLVPSEDGTFTLGTVTNEWRKLYAGEAQIDDININTNVIQTTNTNQDLELRASGTGSIKVDDLSFKTNIISSTGDMILDPGSETVDINSTGSLTLPRGTTAQRPGTPAVGMLRYNTDTDVFEGYDGQWITLNGVRDVDQDTYILAEATPGADDDTLYFYAGGQLVADVNQTRFNVEKLAVDDIEIEGNTVRTVTTNADLNLRANGTGRVLVENFGFNANSITNTVAGAVTTLAQTGDGYFKIEGTGGFVIPVGDLSNRHPTPETGMMRFNTQDDRVELYDNTGQWVSVAGSSGAVSAQDAEEIAIKMAVTIG